MKILHLSASLSRRAGGIFEIELAIAQNLQRLGVDCAALGLVDSNWSNDAARWSPVPASVCPTRGPRMFGYAPDLLPKLFEARADLIHLHYMWMYPSVTAAKWASHTGRRYIVTPNGMLEPWALRNSAWKKKLAGLLYEDRMLRGAACLQANTVKEAADFRAYGLKNPVAVIPNGIDLPTIPKAEILKTETLRGSSCSMSACQHVSMSDFAANGRRVLLYLGRIHPKKGLVNLLKAWAAITSSQSSDFCRPSSGWVLAIAGWDQGGHQAELLQLCDELGLPVLQTNSASVAAPKHRNTETPEHDASVLFLGPQFGEDKARCYANCDAFILPSFSEGLPMVVLEAWAYGKPVLMTPECNLPEGFAANAAIRIEQLPDDGRRTADGRPSIEAGLTELFRLPSSDLCSLGANGLRLVSERFTWPQIATDMKSVYEWVLGGGQKPGCVG